MENINNKTELRLIKDLLKLWLKQWYIFVLSFIICAVIGYIYLKLVTPVFEIESRVKLRNDDMGGGMSENSLMKSLGFGKSSGSNIEDETTIMSSHGYLKKAIARIGLNKQYTLAEWGGLWKTDLYENTPIEISYPELLTDTLKAALFFNVSVNGDQATVKLKANKLKLGTYEITSFPGSIQTPYGEFTFTKSLKPNIISLGQSYNLRMSIVNNDIKAQIYKSLITIDFTKKSSDIIILNTADSDVERGKSILKTVVDIYNEESAKDKEIVGNKTVEFLDERLKLVATDLTAADKDIEEFKKKYSLTDIGTDASTFVEQSAEIQSKLIEVETQLNIINLMEDFLSSPDNAYSPIPFNLSFSEKSMSEAVLSYNAELIKRNNLAISSKANSPTLLAIDEQLKAIRKNIQSSVMSVKKGLQITVAALKKKESEFKSRMGEIPTMEMGYVERFRNQKIQQSVYLFLREKREETAVTSLSILPKLKTIDEPYILLTPVAPNRSKTLLAVVFLGGILIPITLISLLPYLKSIRKKK